MEIVTVDGVDFQGLRVETAKAVLLMLQAEKGFLGCGYFNVDTADKLGEAVAVVTGVSSYDDMLGAKVIRVSRQAAAMGISEGMSGREALHKLAS